MISDTASQTSSVATEPAELSDVDLQLRAVDIAAFQAAPHLLAQAASSKIGLSYPNDEASLDLLVGTLVRLRSPWRDPRIPMYSAARLDVLRAGSIEVDLLHERTRTVLQAAQRTVSLADISDTPLTDRERREAGLPSADASSRLASAEHLFSRRRETIRAAMSTQGYVDQLKAMRAPAGHTEIERRWHELRGGIFEHELCDDSPEDRCPPGHLSLNALIAQTLGADQLAASTGFVRELTPHNRHAVEGRLANQINKLPLEIDGVPVRGPALEILKMTLADADAYAEYVMMLQRDTLAVNQARDASAPGNLANVMTLILNSLRRMLLKLRVVEHPSREDEKCVACFDDMGRGFATGSSYVRLRPCSHWLCLSCAQKMQMHVVGNARCPTCRDPALLWGVHNPQ